MTYHVTEPFTTGADLYANAAFDEESTVRFTVDVPLYTLIEGDIETLNDMVQHSAFVSEGALYDIAYDTKDGAEPGFVRIEVTSGIEVF
jgi:hypothetical protein